MARDDQQGKPILLSIVTKFKAACNGWAKANKPGPPTRPRYFKARANRIRRRTTGAISRLACC